MPDKVVNLLGSIFPPMIGALGTIGGSLLGTSMQSRYNEAAWRMQNEYNSPKNQIALYKSAGFNPASVFSANGKLDSSADAMQTPDLSGAMNAASGAVSNALNMAMLRQQMKNLKLEGESLKEDVRTKQMDNEVKSVQKRLDIDRLLGYDDLWIHFDKEGNTMLGSYNDEEGFNPQYYPDGTPIFSPEGVQDTKLSYYEGVRDALRKGFQTNSEYFLSKMNEIQSKIEQEFGRSKAAALIGQLKASAFAAQEQGRDLKFDNDFFQNLQIEGAPIGGKSAELLLKTILRVLGR